MDAKQVKEQNYNSSQEIDLIELLQKLWEKRYFLLKCGGIAAIIGFIIAFSIPKEYETKAKLAPESSDLSKGMGSLGGLAAIAGINLK